MQNGTNCLERNLISRKIFTFPSVSRNLSQRNTDKICEVLKFHTVQINILIITSFTIAKDKKEPKCPFREGRLNKQCRTLHLQGKVRRICTCCHGLITKMLLLIKQKQDEEPCAMYHILCLCSLYLLNLKMKGCQALVVHAYNPSYSGGRDEGDYGLRPTQANSS
jgi:hypothetical protein